MPHDTHSRVVECLAATTRYPKHLLTSDADLERDLGIDSVKLVEVVIALSEEFSVDLQNEQRDPSIRTIADLGQWVGGFLEADSPAESRAAEPAGGPPATKASPNGADRGGYRAAPEAFHPAERQPAPAPHFAQPAPTANGSSQSNGSNGAHRFDAAAQSFSTRVAEAPSAPQGDLQGRVALVTGSGRGVGKVIAKVLAQRGATVLVNSFHSRDAGEETAAEIRAAGGQSEHFWGSVANPTQVDQMFDHIDREYGLDILVCNASDGRIGSFLDLTADDWDRAFRTNVAGHHQCAVRAAALMRPRGGGSIVTLSAVGAHQYISGLGAQGVVKASVESLTRYLACELGGYGIRVNCVAGGPVYGDLLSKFPDAQAAQDYWESMTPDAQLSSPVELAETIGFLVSDAARGINGAVWMVDHGFSATADGQRRGRVAAVSV